MAAFDQLSADRKVRAVDYVTQLLELQRTQESSQPQPPVAQRGGRVIGLPRRNPAERAPAPLKPALRVSGHLPGYNASELGVPEASEQLDQLVGVYFRRANATPINPSAAARQQPQRPQQQQQPRRPPTAQQWQQPRPCGSSRGSRSRHGSSRRQRHSSSRGSNRHSGGSLSSHSQWATAADGGQQQPMLQQPQQQPWQQQQAPMQQPPVQQPPMPWAVTACTR